MPRYALLVSPSHNRVYAQGAPALAVAELGVAGQRALAGRLHDVRPETVGGVPYVTFELDGGAGPDDAGVLGRLASRYALFEVVPDAGGDLLRPVDAPAHELFGSDLVTIQKYPGKTNEDFTQLLLGATVLGTDSPAALGDPDARLRVLDPMCGRGTTLNQALLYGWDAAGVDVDAKDTDAYATFLRTWLKNNRLKHRAEAGPVRRSGTTLGRRFAAGVGVSKEAWARGESVSVEVVTADTLHAEDFFRRGAFDVVVTDAPYGVQHGTRSRGTGTGPRGRDELDRSPLALLERAVPVWSRLLRRGGALGISWNVRVAPRTELVRLLADAGLEPYDEGPWRGFEHRVDSSIQRDLVVARKP